jgi:hypothetical protein
LIADARGWAPLSLNETATRREQIASNISMFSIQHRAMIDVAAEDEYAVRA